MPGRRGGFGAGSRRGRRGSHSGKRGFSSQQPRAINTTQPVKKAKVEAELESPATPTSGSDTSVSIGTTPFTSIADVVDARIVKNITQGMKFQTMTDVQATTVRPLLSGKDVLAQAKTGTGKTLAFLIPIVQKYIADETSSALLIAPTRELAMQIAEEAEELSAGIIDKSKIQVIVGGTNKNTETNRILKTPPAILVATPGRIIDHFEDPASGSTLLKLKWSTLVLDETDRLLDPGFKRHIEKAVGYLNSSSLSSPSERQTLLFSATISPDVREGLGMMVREGQYEFISTLKAEDINAHERIPQFLMTLPDEATTTLLPASAHVLLREANSTPNFKAIAFLPTARQTGLFCEFFNQLGVSKDIKLLEIHSRMTQSRRTTTSQMFTSAKSAVLFSSDVTARGMDFPDVTHVFQIGLPSSGEQYIHRLGRTGRAGKGGKGITILYPSERSVFNSFPQLRKLLPVIKSQPPPTEAQMDEIRPTVEKAIRRTDPIIRERAYSAWLGYYKTFIGKMGWGPTKLVETANSMAQEAWGLDELPGMDPMIIGKMGLKGVPGLRIEKGMRPPPRGQPRQKQTQEKPAQLEMPSRRLRHQQIPGTISEVDGPPRRGGPGGRKY